MFGILGNIVFGKWEAKLLAEIKRIEEMDKKVEDEMSKHEVVLVNKDKSQIRKTMDTDEIIEKYTGVTDKYEYSKVYKDVAWIGLFSSVTLFQGYLGIKLVFFDGFKPRNNTDNVLVKSIGIFSSIIVLSHMQVYFGGKYIEDCCEPKNKFFNDKIHAHPMFKRKKTKGDWCSSCWDKIHSTHYYCPSFVYCFFRFYITI